MPWTAKRHPPRYTLSSAQSESPEQRKRFRRTGSVRVESCIGDRSIGPSLVDISVPMSVPLNDSAINVLNSLDTKDEDGPLFLSSRGRKRGDERAFTTIAKQWGRIRKAAGLPHLRLHDLRHQFASFLVNDGRTLYEVQQILGHSSSKVTERYAHLSARTLQEASASASARLTGCVPKSAA